MRSSKMPSGQARVRHVEGVVMVPETLPLLVLGGVVVAPLTLLLVLVLVVGGVVVGLGVVRVGVEGGAALKLLIMSLRGDSNLSNAYSTCDNGDHCICSVVGIVKGEGRW